MNMNDLLSYLVNQHSYSGNESWVKVLSWCGHMCQCSEERDAVRAVHLTQPLHKSLLVLCVYEKVIFTSCLRKFS